MNIGCSVGIWRAGKLAGVRIKATHLVSEVGYSLSTGSTKGNITCFPYAGRKRLQSHLKKEQKLRSN